jgi:large subunit ribosomal protein L6
MSRIGKKAITVPAGVKVRHDSAARTVNVEGPKGKLSCSKSPEFSVALADGDNQNVCTI